MRWLPFSLKVMWYKPVWLYWFPYKAKMILLWCHRNVLKIGLVLYCLVIQPHPISHIRHVAPLRFANITLMCENEKSGMQEVSAKNRTNLCYLLKSSSLTWYHQCSIFNIDSSTTHLVNSTCLAVHAWLLAVSTPHSWFYSTQRQ